MFLKTLSIAKTVQRWWWIQDEHDALVE